MNKQQQLAKAIEIATEGHSGQFDKAGKPYILHPLHLMQQCLFDPELAAIAVLHDAIEDSDVTIYSLYTRFFSTRVTDALELLTHDEYETYDEYINCICDSANYDAIRVKRKDLEHNSDITRLKGITEKDLKRIEKYHRAFIKLGEAKMNYLNNK